MKKKKAIPKKLTHKKGTAGRRKKAPGSKLTIAQKDFIDAVIKVGGNIERASEMAGISKWAHYEWKKHSPVYVEAYDNSLGEAKQVREAKVEAALQEAWEKGWDEEIIEQEMEARVINGETTLVPVKQKQRRTKRRFLNALIYEGNRLWGNPARLEVTGVGGGPIQAKVSVEAFRELAGLNG